MKNKINIISYTRSGTNFLKLNLKNNIVAKNIQIYKKPLIDFSNKDRLRELEIDDQALNISVIRNPKDAIISSFSHAEYFNPRNSLDFDQFEITESILEQSRIYQKHLDFYEANFNNILFYRFEELSLAVNDILNSFFNQGLIEDLVHPDSNDFFKSSTANTSFYKFLETEVNPEIWENITKSYIKFIENVNTLI